jgi:hypothetical protein
MKQLERGVIYLRPIFHNISQHVSPFLWGIAGTIWVFWLAGVGVANL